MKLPRPNEEPDKRLNIGCFALPCLLILPAPFLDGWAGLSGVILGLLLALFAGARLMFRPSRALKFAAWSYLFGCAVAMGFLIVGVSMTMSGQSSPWLQ